MLEFTKFAHFVELHFKEVMKQRKSLDEEDQLFHNFEGENALQNNVLESYLKEKTSEHAAGQGVLKL